MRTKRRSKRSLGTLFATMFSKKYRLFSFVGIFALVGGAIYLGTSFAATTPVAYLRNGLSTGSADITFAFGDRGDVPVACNWDGDGPDGFGVRRPSNVRFYLSDTLTPTKVNKELAFGNQGDIPICGDWNGDKKAGVGVFRPEDRTFYLSNEIKPDAKVTKIAFGQKGDIPLACDWNGDGKTDIGVYRPSNAHFYLSYKTLGKVDYDIHFGDGGDQPVCGDWNGDKKAGIGIHRPSNSKFYLTNGSVPSTQGAGRTEKPTSPNEKRKWDVNYEFMYGNGGGQQVFAGDWNGDGRDSVAIYRMDTPPGWRKPETPQTPTLKKGDNGPEVTKLQTRLAGRGFWIAANGNFNDATETTVKWFQDARGIPINGQADIGTMLQLSAAEKEGWKFNPNWKQPPDQPPQPPQPPVGTPTLQLGSQGEAVSSLQSRLAGRGFWIAANGDFNGATQSTVVSFQKVRRISADGVVGPQTWGQLGAAEAEGWRFNPNDPLLNPSGPENPNPPQPPPPPPPPPQVATGICRIMGSNGDSVIETAMGTTAEYCKQRGIAFEYAGASPVSSRWQLGSAPSVTVWASGSRKGQCTVGNSTATMTRAECWAFAAFFNRTDSTWYDSNYAFTGPRWKVFPYVSKY